MFLRNNLSYLKPKNIQDFGQKCFFCGTFFLSSALPISAFFYLISIGISIHKINISFAKDKYNQILLISSGIMIFSNINAGLKKDSFSSYSLADIWLDLFNWFPLFLLFISSQRYLKSSQQRKLFSKFLISGTIPVLISCFMQAWLGIEGPLKTFNGLIIWYLDKVNYSDIAISGLFSNRNYTATWLSAVLGFSLFEMLDKNKNIYQKLLITIISILIFLFTILTFSRSGIISIFITLIIIFRKYKVILPLISFYGLSNFIVLTLLSKKVIDLKDLISLKVARLLILNPENFLNFNRIELLGNTYNLILENPILGWGASTFSHFYRENNGIEDVQHTHNIFLELSYNYGVILGIVLTGFVLKLLINGFKSIYFSYFWDSNFLIDICWLTSTTVICINQLLDFTYYDGKISILIWILLSGIKSIIQDKRIKLNVQN